MKSFLASRTFRLIWSAGIALLLYFSCPPCFPSTTLLILLAVLVLIVNLAEYIARATWLTHTARFLVGGLFIFSGFIKANDPLGFSYKLGEYFDVFKADTGLGIFESFAHIALPLSVIICASEIILGLMLLIGYRRDLTLWLLFAQIVFFTFLTFYSACYNKVTHCGCFGDFLKLKPWESFWKDVALMYLIALLFAGRRNINPLFPRMITSTVFLIGLVFAVAFPVYSYRNLPMLDFRAYAPGMNIKENMKPGAGYKPDSTVVLLRYSNLKTGEKKDFANAEYVAMKVWEDTLTWKYDTMLVKVAREAINPPKISDFHLSGIEGDDVTESLLNEANYSFWLVAYDLKKTEDDEELVSRIDDFYKLATAENYKFIGITASNLSEIDAFKHEHNALYDFVLADQTVLKTMIRSNPGLMLMRNGTVIANWHHRNFPSFAEVKKNHLSK
jgi:hypothetical protein